MSEIRRFVMGPSRASVTNISSCHMYVLVGREQSEQLGGSLGYIFLLFPMK